ncbi:uncharacterized protein MONBRDRAFT_24157, partial [Monosiga brevicollis MX1]
MAKKQNSQIPHHVWKESVTAAHLDVLAPAKDERKDNEALGVSQNQSLSLSLSISLSQTLSLSLSYNLSLFSHSHPFMGGAIFLVIRLSLSLSVLCCAVPARAKRL